MLDTLEMMYGVSPSIQQEEMNTQVAEDKDTTFRCFLKFRNFKNYIGTFVTNQCLRVKNCTFNPILKSKYGSLHEFPKKSKKIKIVEKWNKLV